jgi:GNAT superfamily N-acetyltransferase
VEGARRAEPGDAARLRALRRAARVELGPMRGGELFLRREGEEREPDDGAERPVWAGTIDGEVVGYAAAHADDLGEGRRLGVIDAIFVEEGARAVGVGEALMEAVLSWCREQGCFGVDAAALPGHRSTKNFFEGSGFTARLLVMHHRLGGGDG